MFAARKNPSNNVLKITPCIISYTSLYLAVLSGLCAEPYCTRGIRELSQHDEGENPEEKIRDFLLPPAPGVRCVIQ